MVGLPRAIIKKYGVTKRAWAVFRAGKNKRSSGGVTRRIKKRAGARGVVRMARRGRRSRSSGGMFGGGKQGMLGGTFKGVLAGFGAASLVQNMGFAGIFPEAAAGYVAGGVPGALGGAAHVYVKIGGGGVSIGSGALYG